MDIINYWLSNKKNWFEANPLIRAKIDEDIKTLYINNLNILEKYSIADINALNIIDIISSIIILDQFSRHVYRDKSIHNIQKIENNTKKAALISLAVIYGLNHNYLIKVNDKIPHIVCHQEKVKSLFKCHENYVMDITSDLLFFILMPLKHSNIMHHWNCIKRTLLKFDYVDHVSLFRFYKDTVRKVCLKSNEICITNGPQYYPIFDKNWKKITDFLPNNFKNIKSILMSTIIKMK